MTQAIDPVTYDELNTLKGSDITTTLQAQIDAIGTTVTLDQGKIFIGNASNVPTDQSLSGGATITETGVVTLGPNHGFATTATAAGTTTLTVSSAVLQYFTGSTTQTVVLPVASTLSLGWKVRIVNSSTGAVTVNSSGGNAVATVSPSTCVEITCIVISGTDASSWSADFTNAKITNRLLTGYVSGAGTVAATDTILQAIQKLNGNIEQAQPAEVVLSADATIDSVYPTYEDATGLVVSFTTTRANQPVDISLAGGILATGAPIAFFAYKLDAGADQPLSAINVPSGGYANPSCSFRVIPATAAGHTVQIRGAVDANSFKFGGSGGAAEITTRISATLL